MLTLSKSNKLPFCKACRTTHCPVIPDPPKIAIFCIFFKFIREFFINKQLATLPSTFVMIKNAVRELFVYNSKYNHNHWCLFNKRLILNFND